jgi:serine/tyrosine/threonine adenylyltransferase
MPKLPTFRSRVLDTLAGDRSGDLAPRQVHGALWSTVVPTPVAAPRLLAWSEPLARELGLDPALPTNPGTAAVLGGNALWPGMAPYAANYGGHQFGHWAGQLGDGRAIVLGELVKPDGQTVEVQIKGAGPTPYSRRGDGRAVLRSSLREFLCSEAMHHLGVPTTRALSLVGTGDDVVRDMFYDGNARPEPGAITCRVAPTFLRFGSFELPASRGDVPLLTTLVDDTLRQWFPDLLTHGTAAPAALLREVAGRTARLIAHWQAIGFVHGVLNTDNLSILGLTIDYGPYGFVEPLEFDWTPNTTDAHQRRYAFGNQPTIGLWNTARLGEALLPLLPSGDRDVEDALEHYRAEYARAVSDRFAAKLGLESLADDGDQRLVQDLFAWLGARKTDLTLFFRALCDAAEAPEPATLPATIAAACYEPTTDDHLAAGLAWLRRWRQRLARETRPSAEIAASMRRHNPWFVLRNWIAHEAIVDAERGDLARLHVLLKVLERPYEEQPGHEALARKRPRWADDQPGCAALSCSS